MIIQTLKNVRCQKVTVTSFMPCILKQGKGVLISRIVHITRASAGKGTPFLGAGHCRSFHLLPTGTLWGWTSCLYYRWENRGSNMSSELRKANGTKEGSQESIQKWSEHRQYTDAGCFPRPSEWRNLRALLLLAFDFVTVSKGPMSKSKIRETEQTL